MLKNTNGIKFENIERNRNLVDSIKAIIDFPVFKALNYVEYYGDTDNMSSASVELVDGSRYTISCSGEKDYAWYLDYTNLQAFGIKERILDNADIAEIYMYFAVLESEGGYGKTLDSEDVADYFRKIETLLVAA